MIGPEGLSCLRRHRHEEGDREPRGSRTRHVLRQDPCSGAVFALRGRRGDRVKLLYWDGQGFCLYYKVLERGRFPWPSPADGTARLTPAQLAMLWEGIDWRRPSWGAPPSRVA